jgi:tight adherence protein C
MAENSRSDYMLVYIFIAFGLFIFVNIWLVIDILTSRNVIDERLEQIGGERKFDHNNTDKSIGQRLRIIFVEKGYKFITKISPKGFISWINRKLNSSGIAFKKDGLKVYYSKFLVVTFLIPMLMFWLFLYLTESVSNAVLITFLFIMINFVIQIFSLNSMARRRKSRMLKELPDVLDLITVSVEAGLSFDGAVDRLVKTQDSYLSQEFSVLLKHIKMGKNRKEALREFAKRIDISEITSFVSSIIQGEELGVSIGNILRIQSKQIRDKTRERIRERSMKAPIKMLFPIIFFIFPVIFIILLGPALIQITRIFM